MKAIKVNCPSCDAALRLAQDKVTAKTRCPKCGSALRAALGMSRAAAEESEDSAAEAKPSRSVQQRDEIAAWKKVRLGLLVLLIVTGANLLSGIVGQLISMFAVRWLIAHFAFGIRYWFGFALCEIVATLAAYVLLGFTPKRYAPRSLIVAVIALAVLTDAVAAGALVYAANALFAAGDGDLAAATGMFGSMHKLMMLMIPVQLLGALQVILVPLFLRQVAHAMEDARAAHLCDTIVKWTAIGLALQMIGPFLRLIPLGLITVVAGVIGLGGFVLSAATRVAYVFLALNLRESIDEHMHRLRPRRTKRTAGETAADARSLDTNEDS